MNNMNKTDLFQEFIQKLKKDKSDAEVGKIITDLLKFDAQALYITILTELDEEDYKAINEIKEEKEADEELKRRFKLNTGKTPEEFIIDLRDEIAKNNLFPELTNPSTNKSH